MHETKIGFSAQNLLELIPEAVVTHESQHDTEGNLVSNKELDFYAVTYDMMLPVIVNAVKEQQELIETLKGQNETLTKTINELNSKLENVKSSMTEFKSKLYKHD